jgi:hypothetical protein
LLLEHAVDGLAVITFAQRRKDRVPKHRDDFHHRVQDFRNDLRQLIAVRTGEP